MTLSRRAFSLGLGINVVLANQVLSHGQQAARVPDWRPDFTPDPNTVVERFRHYSDGKHDFIVLQHTTCCIVPNDLSAAEAMQAAKHTLSHIIGFHPDMNPRRMTDGNVLITYNQPAYNIIPKAFAKQHQAEIKARHLQGLVKDEVLVTPNGQNVFDEVGQIALLGRSYMFMDAQAPVLLRHERAG